MTVAIPRERCYYFECSDGKVRLTLFIPRNELSKLMTARKISPSVRDDFPDGVDLDCTEPDFAEFEEQYGYRPDHSAETLRNAFFAIFSSTRGWKTYRGSGLIPAAELEEKIAAIDRAVRRAVPEAADVPTPPEITIADMAETRPPPLKDRRRRTNRLTRLQSRIERALEKVPVKGVDDEKPIDEQPFARKISWGKGRSASEVFSLLQQRQQRRT